MGSDTGNDDGARLKGSTVAIVATPGFKALPPQIIEDRKDGVVQSVVKDRRPMVIIEGAKVSGASFHRDLGAGQLVEDLGAAPTERFKCGQEPGKPGLSGGGGAGGKIAAHPGDQGMPIADEFGQTLGLGGGQLCDGLVRGRRRDRLVHRDRKGQIKAEELQHLVKELLPGRRGLGRMKELLLDSQVLRDLQWSRDVESDGEMASHLGHGVAGSGECGQGGAEEG